MILEIIFEMRFIPLKEVRKIFYKFIYFKESTSYV